MTITQSLYRARGSRSGWLVIGAVLLLVGTSYGYREWIRSRQMSSFAQCQEARHDGNWVKLQQSAEQWTAWDRRNADAWLFLADAHQHQNDFESAAKCLESVPEDDPKALPTLVGLSTLQFGSLNRPLDGVQTCERILRLEPKTTAAHQQLIEFYAISLQRRKLEDQIRFSISCSREPPIAYVYLFLIDTMRVKAGVELNTQWLNRYPDCEIFMVSRVLQMPEPESGVKTGAGDDKYALVESLFARFPRNLELLAHKVDLCIRKGNAEELMGLLQNLPAEADADPRFWRAKGWLHLTRNELSKAKRALQQAMDLYPLDWNARNWMSDVLRHEGHNAEAGKLQEIVAMARELRSKITANGSNGSNGSNGEIPHEILRGLAELSNRCGDAQVAKALSRRFR